MCIYQVELRVCSWARFPDNSELSSIIFLFYSSLFSLPSYCHPSFSIQLAAPGPVWGAYAVDLAGINLIAHSIAPLLLVTVLVAFCVMRELVDASATAVAGVGGGAVDEEAGAGQVPDPTLLSCGWQILGVSDSDSPRLHCQCACYTVARILFSEAGLCCVCVLLFLFFPQTLNSSSSSAMGLTTPRVGGRYQYSDAQL